MIPRWCQKRDRDLSIKRYITVFYCDFSAFNTVENTVLASASVLDEDSNRCGRSVTLSHQAVRSSAPAVLPHAPAHKSRNQEHERHKAKRGDQKGEWLDPRTTHRAEDAARSAAGHAR